MIRAALLGLGKMGLSHQSMINAHPDIDLVGICDTSTYMLDIVGKYTGVPTYTDYRRMFQDAKLDAVFIATPSRFHQEMVQAALDADLHVFCEKPFCLDLDAGMRFAEIAESKGLVNQVGYHYRFVGAFEEMKRLLDAKAIGRLHHLRAEAYGPVVLRPKGSTWRTSKSEGGGCLYDYACHVIDLANYLVGPPLSVSGTSLASVFSNDVEDEVYANLQYADGLTGQLAANWSDDSHRKMSASITVWGEGGKITANRTEIQVFLREKVAPPAGYQAGWNVRYTTDLTEDVWFYVRGEEYSAQIDHFARAILSKDPRTRSTFRSAVDTDRVAAALIRDAAATKTAVSVGAAVTAASPPARSGGLLQRLLGGVRA